MSERGGERRRGTGPRLSRFDVVLGVIPSAYAVGTVAGMVTALSLWVTLLVASTVTLVGLADALVINPPT